MQVTIALNYRPAAAYWKVGWGKAWGDFMAGCEGVAPRSGVKILLVEDDEATLELISLFLGRHYSITACSSGERALHALCADDDITVIVTDLRMPGVNGYDILRCAAEHSRRTGRTIPAVVLTGHGTPEDEQQARSFGVAHFQRKPIDLIQLRQAIEMCRNAAGAPASARPARFEPANE